MSGLRVVALRDIDFDKAAGLSARFNIPRASADAGSFYDARLQSVHIATPPQSHEELAAEGLDHGCHVLVEKPPAMTSDGCSALLRRARVRATTIAVNENTAAHPLIHKARRLLETKRLGQLLHIDSFLSFGLPAGARPPVWVDQLPGGMLEDLLPHLLTTARAIAGVPLAPQHWHLRSTGQGSATEHDELHVLLAGEANVTVQLTLSLFAQPSCFVLSVRGSRATLTIDLRNLLFQLSIPGPRDGAIASGCRLVCTAGGMVCQTARNVFGMLCGYRHAYGSFLPLIRAHYAALETGGELPAPLCRAAETVSTVRTIWPIARQGLPCRGRPAS